MIALTSIVPDPARVPTLRAYLDTWRTAGLTPVSLNHPSEVAALRDLYPGVEFVATAETAEAAFGRPYVRVNALLDWVAQHGPALFINADLHLTATPAQLARLGELAATSLPYLLQYNHTSTGVHVVEPCGISAFLMSPRLVPLYATSYLCLGKPWWDYWVPYAAQRAGVPLCCPTQVLCVHEAHTRSGWSEDDWLRCAGELARLAGAPVPADMAAGSRYSALVHGAIVAATQAVTL